VAKQSLFVGTWHPSSDQILNDSLEMTQLQIATDVCVDVRAGNGFTMTRVAKWIRNSLLPCVSTCA